LICLFSDQRKAGAFPLGPTLALFDCAMAAQNMMLRAWDLGLGSCVMRSTNLEAVREILQTPERLRPELLLMLGYPASVPPAPARDEGAIHWERYRG
jgi:nitroreductase